MALDFSFGERSELAPELNALLLNLAAATQRRIMYPGDHPSAAPVIATLAAHALRALADRPQLVIAVTSDRLLIDGAAADPRHVLLRSLAQRLSRHQLAGIVLIGGLEPAELAALVDALAGDPEGDSTRLGSAENARLTGCPRVRLCPVQFDRLRLVEDGERQERGNRSGVLWLELASAAVSRELDGAAAVLEDPAALARAIELNAATRQHRQAVANALHAIAAAIPGSNGPDLDVLRDRVSAVVAALGRETIEDILRELDADSRASIVRHLVAALSGEAGLRLLGAAAEASGHALSTGLTRILARLASHARSGNERMTLIAAAALREQLAEVAGEWADRQAQDEADRTRRARRSATPASQQVEPMRLVTMSLEVGVASDALHGALHALTSGRHLPALLDALEAGSASAASAFAWRQLLSAPTVHHLLSSQPVDLRTFDRLLPYLRGQTLEAVFDALATSDSRAIRRALLDRLLKLGPEVGRIATRRLDDPRWFVVRNMLMLVAEMRELPTGLDVARYLAHSDARVRAEALRVALRSPELRMSSLARVLQTDRDPRVVWLALSTLRSECPPWAVTVLGALIDDPALSEDLRSVALRVVGGCAEPEALELLLRLSDTRQSTLTDADRTAAEALRLLAVNWAADARARRAVSRASSWFRPRLRSRLQKRTS